MPNERDDMLPKLVVTTKIGTTMMTMKTSRRRKGDESQSYRDDENQP